MKKRIIFAASFIAIMLSLSVGLGAAASIDTSWGPIHETGGVFEWTIVDVENETGGTTWTWDLLGVDLIEGEKITFEWRFLCECQPIIEITSDHPSTGIPFDDWTAETIEIGSTTLDADQTKAMRGLILPVYVLFGGDTFSGFSAMEGYWWNSFPFPNAVSGAGEDWNLDLDKTTADLSVIGENAGETDLVKGYIFNVDYPHLINGTVDPNYIGRQNILTFDIAYNASEGMMTSLKFPSAVTQNVGDDAAYPGPYPAVANNATYLSAGLNSLEISLTSVPESDGWSAATTSAPGFGLIIALGSFAVVAIVVSRKRK